MTRALIAKIICLSAGARALRAQFKTEYLAEKALEAAKIIEKQETPEFVAVLFAAIAGNVLNELSPGRIELFVEEAVKTLRSESVLEMDACLEEIVSKEAKARSDALDALKADEKKAETKEPEVVPPAPEVVAPLVVAPEVPKVDEPTIATSPSIDTLAIAAKHKAALKSAGLATFADVILYEQTKGIESLPDIGEKSASQILALVGYKKAE